MAKVIPFRAVRPASDKVHLVATRSYVSYSRANLKRKLAENPYSFIHVINPEFSLNKPEVKGVARFPLVREKYLEFVRKGVLVQDEEPAYYIYQQIQPNDSFIGIICGISVEDYKSGMIRVHEQTITRREKLFKDYLDVCNFNAEPVLFTYPDNSTLNDTIAHTIRKKPDIDFSTTDHIRHKLWLVENPAEQAVISTEFGHTSRIYIADGHHRSASSSLLSDSRKANNPNHTGDEMYNYIMACLIPESQLSIYDFNRAVKDLNGHSPEEFLYALSAEFEIIEQPGIYAPERLHEMAMYLNNKWYALRLKNDPRSDSPTDQLDAQILSDKILGPLLDITDLKTNSRIEFVSGKVGMDGLQIYAQRKKMAVAFGLFPVTVNQLKLVADAHEIMPPKTTWIEPKLRSGLTIFSFDD